MGLIIHASPIVAMCDRMIASPTVHDVIQHRLSATGYENLHTIDNDSLCCFDVLHVQREIP